MLGFLQISLNKVKLEETHSLEGISIFLSVRIWCSLFTIIVFFSYFMFELVFHFLFQLFILKNLFVVVERIVYGSHCDASLINNVPMNFPLMVEWSGLLKQSSMNHRSRLGVDSFL